MIMQLAEKYHDYMIEKRRYLHMHPEVSLHEHETSALIRQELERLGIPYTVAGDIGVVATIEGAHPGKTIALRADIDALPVQELSEDCPYKSQNPGVMHACGHDGHTAALLGAAHMLLEVKDQIHGTVKLVFESGEEVGGTMKILEAAGVLEGIDHCFGMHLWTDLPVGTVNCEAGARMAGTDLFNLKITGLGAHGAEPHKGIDAVVAASSIVMNLQTIVSRELSPQDLGLVTIGKMTAGTRFNAIATEAVLEGNLRYFDPAIGEAYPKIINRIAENTAAAFRAKSEMTLYFIGTPPLINKPEDTAFGQSVVKKLLGDAALRPLDPLMVGEDFAIFMQKVGGVHMFVGAGFTDRENVPHHNGNFDFDENALKIAAALHVQYALDYLAKEN